MHLKSLAGLLGVLLASPVLAAGSDVDANASFDGPFNGAQSSVEMAQSFEMSVTGYLHGIDAFVPSDPGPSCEFTWYLRDGATLNPGSPDISALPVLATGTGMTDTPSGIYDAQPSTLLTWDNIPVSAGDVLVLHIVRDCSFLWVAGVGSLPGDRYQSDGATWTASAVTYLEYGRTVYASDSVLPVDAESWGSMKARYR
ncbi:hypothetical protein K8I85_12555 [bacterium]|nr:hypothetical protein [bacterium]